MSTVAPALILETGTYLGTTTELLAETGIPIVSVEANARNFGFPFIGACAAFATLSYGLAIAVWKRAMPSTFIGAHYHRGRFSPISMRTGTRTYLSPKNWTIVFARCPNAVAMVDDFRVPDDPGYGYDDFGPGLALDQSYIAPTAEAHRLTAFYPTLPSSKETGMRRGCVVLAKRYLLG